MVMIGQLVHGTHEGRIFEGWFLWENGAFGNKVELGKPIDLTGLKENESVILRSKYKSKFKVTYKDELGTVLETDTVDNEDGAYTVDRQYTPYDPDKGFLGWEAVESTGGNISADNISDSVYPNGTAVTLSGNVVLKAYTPVGNWLSFNENGVGASYTAPQFVKKGENAVRPDYIKSKYDR